METVFGLGEKFLRQFLRQFLCSGRSSFEFLLPSFSSSVQKHAWVNRLYLVRPGVFCTALLFSDLISVLFCEGKKFGRPCAQ